MLPTALIAFREFFEAFLIIGIFLGLSKQLQLKKETEILIAAGIGILLSLGLAVGTFLLGDSARAYLSESGAELLGGYVMLLSGIFIAYVVYSLHKTMGKAHHATVERTKQKFAEETFDVALFFTIVGLILREGFEVALFTASVSLFSDFLSNVYGLLFGFAGAAVLGSVVYLAYTKLPIKKIFTITEYAIIAFGAMMFAFGLTKVLEGQFGVVLSESFLIPVCAVLLYLFAVYFLFMKKTAHAPAS